MKKLSFGDLENGKYYWMHSFDVDKSVWRVVQSVKLDKPMPYVLCPQRPGGVRLNTPYIQWIGPNVLYDEPYFSYWVNVFFIELENPWKQLSIIGEPII